MSQIFMRRENIMMGILETVLVLFRGREPNSFSEFLQWAHREEKGKPRAGCLKLSLG